MGRFDASGLTRGIMEILKDRKRHRLAFLVQELGPRHVPYGVAIESYESMIRAVRKYQKVQSIKQIPDEQKVVQGYRERVLDALNNLRLIRTKDETGLVVRLNPELLECAWCRQPYWHSHRTTPKTPTCVDCQDEANKARWKGKEAWRKNPSPTRRSLLSPSKPSR